MTRFLDIATIADIFICILLFRFLLTEEERKRLANFPVGQGLFFAGQNHVHIQIVASQTEQGLITTSPLTNQQAQPQQPGAAQTLPANGYMNPGENGV